MLIVIGGVLIYQDGNEAHVFNGFALNLRWQESSAESKLIVGFGVLLLVLVTLHRRRASG